MTGRCECPEFRTGLTCGRAAAWLVQVGRRLSDAQLSCRLHLSRTCEIMLGAETMLTERTVTLTVTALTADSARLVDMARAVFAGSQEVPE